MNVRELEALCGEIREEIIRVVSEKAGILRPIWARSSLQWRCTMCFKTPEDKLIFDVGHQGVRP